MLLMMIAPLGFLIAWRIILRYLKWGLPNSSDRIIEKLDEIQDAIVDMPASRGAEYEQEVYHHVEIEVPQ
jgi:hypothetical protein